MNEDKILQIFKKNSLYNDSEVFIKDFEIDAEDENENNIFYDEKFIVEDVGSMYEYTQTVKLDFVEAIIKEAQIEILRQLWHTTSDFGQKKRYELIYDKIVKKLNELEK